MTLQEYVKYKNCDDADKIIELLNNAGSIANAWEKCDEPLWMAKFINIVVYSHDEMQKAIEVLKNICITFIETIDNTDVITPGYVTLVLNSLNLDKDDIDRKEATIALKEILHINRLKNRKGTKTKIFDLFVFMLEGNYSLCGFVNQIENCLSITYLPRKSRLRKFITERIRSIITPERAEELWKAYQGILSSYE